jgi:hypothetical protein
MTRHSRAKPVLRGSALSEPMRPALALAALAALLLTAYAAPKLMEPGCGKIPSQTLRDGCYWEYAVSKGEPGICGMLSGSGMPELCLRKLGQDEEIRTVCDILEYPLAVSKCEGLLGNRTI